MKYHDAVGALRGGQAVSTEHILATFGLSSKSAEPKSKSLGTAPGAGPERLVDLG